MVFFFCSVVVMSVCAIGEEARDILKIFISFGSPARISLSELEKNTEFVTNKAHILTMGMTGT